MHVKMIIGTVVVMVLVPAVAFTMLWGQPGQVLELEAYSFNIVMDHEIPVFSEDSSILDQVAPTVVRNNGELETHLFLGAVLTEGNRELFDSLEVEVKEGSRSCYWGPLNRLSALPLGAMAQDEVRHFTLALSLPQESEAQVQESDIEVQFLFRGHPDLMPVSGININNLLPLGLFLLTAALLLHLWRR